MAKEFKERCSTALFFRKNKLKSQLDTNPHPPK